MPVRALFLTLLAAFAVYTIAVYSGPPMPSAIATRSERRGMALWQEHNCVACHQLYGLGGYMGPDLTNTISTKGTERVRTFVRYGTGRMPAHELNDEDLNALVAYLAWVDRSGSSRVPVEAVHWTGTYLIEPR